MSNQAKVWAALLGGVGIGVGGTLLYLYWSTNLKQLEPPPATPGS